MTLSIGDYAPDFTLPTDGNGRFSLSQHLGKKVVVYFYPKDDTTGCTAEACDFRDSMNRLAPHGVAVVGISKDSVMSHDKFKSKYGLNFPLASDENDTVCEDYGVWVEKSMYGKSYMGIERCTFLIDEQGRISYIWRKVSVPGHVDEVLSAISGKLPAANNNISAKPSSQSSGKAGKSSAKKKSAKKPAKKAAKKPAKKAVKKSIKKMTKKTSKKSTSKAKAKSKTKAKTMKAKTSAKKSKKSSAKKRKAA